MKLPSLKQYRAEEATWRKHGSPVRSRERIAELFAICAACPQFAAFTASEGQCQLCTCLISRTRRKVNKLRWATTRCPLPEPAWVEEPGAIAGKRPAKCC